MISLLHITSIIQQDRQDLCIHLADLKNVESPITPPDSWLISRAMLSVCSPHWQYDTEREILSITVLADVYSENELRDFPVVYAFLLWPPANVSPPGYTHLQTAAKNEPSSCIRSPEPRSEPLPSLSFRGRTELAGIHASIQHEFSTYSILSPPSRTGTAVIAFHNERESDPSSPTRTLATFARGQVLFRSIDHITSANPSATRSLYIEFYSGAVYYTTANSDAVVIQYFD